MELTLQKTLRFAIPAVMLYVLAYLSCWASHWCSIEMPVSYDIISKSLLFFLLGGLYAYLPLRDCANRPYDLRVGENLLQRLTSPFAADPAFPRDLGWDRASIVFYRFVDDEKEKSLAVQMRLALWNGVLWSSAADLRAISALGVVAIAAMMFVANLFGDPGFDTAKAVAVLLLLIVLFLVSIGFSEWTTRRQMSIGNRQAEIIILERKDELRTRLIAAAAA
jgi:hypothetical protein